jgi:nitrogen regulatory protein P-II 1
MSYEYRKVIAIVRISQLERVEKALEVIRVGGASVTRVKGYGQHKDFFEGDWLAEYARLEILAGAARAQQIVDAILSSASTGTTGDGIVSVLPVERIWRIRSCEPTLPEEI